VREHFSTAARISRLEAIYLRAAHEARTRKG
jgi:hypothetical protein